MYRSIDATFLRAAAGPADLNLPPWPDLSGTTHADTQQLRQWMQEVWAQQAIAEAIEVASPFLARRVRDICAEQPRQARRVRRAAESLVRYLLRMQHRATPFGLFAGVAPAHFGSGLTMRWGEDHQAVAHADAEWLSEVITRLETCPELLRRLPVVADNTCFVRGTKLVVPCQQPPHGWDGARGVAAEVSLRYTRAVKTVLAAAQSSLPVGDLAGKVAAEYPDTPSEVIDRLLAELVARRVLLSSLHPPMTVTDALCHVVHELSAVEAASIPQAAPTVRELQAIATALARHNRADPGTRRHLRAAASLAMAALSDAVEQPLVVDLRLDCSLVLPQAVAREAENATTALARLTRYPAGPLAWQDYHARFLERYGTGALVPVRDLVDSNVGLGFPAGYRGSLAERPQPPVTRRDEKLLALAQRAAMDGTGEIVLNDQTLSDLATHDTGRRHVPAHASLRFQVEAPTRTALEQGAFTLVVVGLSSAAGTTAGRFLHLLDEPDRTRMNTAYANLPTLEQDALSAQVSSPPLRVRTENVGRVSVVLPHVIALAEHGDPDRALPLDDLAVGADHQRLYVMSLSRRRTVEPAVLNAVELTNFTHPLARFLCEVPRARAGTIAPFSWGAIRSLPFQPRIRYGRTVLAQARWRLEAADLAEPDAPWPQWTAAMTAWRHRFRLPDAVHLGDDDQRLRLTLDEPAHLHLLRARLDRTGHAILREAPEPSAHGWIDGRSHEIAVSLVSTRKPAWPPARRRASSVVIGRDHGHFPGASKWAFAKLYGHPDHAPDILTTHLRDLFDGWGTPPQWWYVRYRDPEPHLRLRLRLPRTEAFGATAQRVATWADQLRSRGLIGRMQWDTYAPETGRYGTGAAMNAAEIVFAADSEAAIAQMALTAGEDLHPAVTAASYVDLATSFTTGTREGMYWLIAHLQTPSGPGLDRHTRDEALCLADPDANFAALRAVRGGEKVISAWNRRRKAMTAYRDCLTTTGETDPTTVLTSLLHMHHIRTAGLNETCEHTCRRLARSAALSWTTRNQGAPT
ncbi:lantibiotic dehydratase [Streptomyces sp. NPDC050610]|uniref:lantibiotic dehydratase n=1 Tax=Streptomyces sp. NPDC050610 TaxID=3157097 RepID=UPI00342DEB3E